MGPSLPTLLGLAAILLWSTSGAVIVHSVENLGPFTALALISGTAGLFLAVLETVRRRRITAIFNIGAEYCLFGGIAFVLYMLLLYFSFSLAQSREVAVQLNMVNYLWPVMIILFSISFAKPTIRLPLLVPGLVFGFTGIVVTLSNNIDLQSFLPNLVSNRLSFLLMFLAAICWGLYSNVAKKYHEAGKANGTALFFLIVAVIAAGVRFAAHEHSMPSATVMMPVLYAGLVPAGIGYLLWEIGMKRGDITLLASASYLLALTSTLFTCWYLHVALGANLLIGALLTVVGALLTNRGVRVVQKV